MLKDNVSIDVQGFDLAMISETVKAGLLGFDMQIPELVAQRKFVSAACRAHSNAHKPPKRWLLQFL